MNRRSVLGGVAGAFAGLAGCLESGPVADRSTPTVIDSSPDVATSTSTESDKVPPFVKEATLHTGDGSCGNETTVYIGATDDGIRATGTIVASTPCYTPRLLGIDDDETVVRFRIGVEQPQDTAACVQCLAEIHFELTAVFHGSFDEVILHLMGADPTTIRKRL